LSEDQRKELWKECDVMAEYFSKGGTGEAFDKQDHPITNKIEDYFLKSLSKKPL